MELFAEDGQFYIYLNNFIEDGGQPGGLPRGKHYLGQPQLLLGKKTKTHQKTQLFTKLEILRSLNP